MNNFINNHAATITGWSGIIKSATPHWYTKEHLPYQKGMGYKDGPAFVHGAISLYPKREWRYSWSRGFGWICLDLYFKVYKLDTIDLIMETKVKTPLIFWGNVKERFNPEVDYKELEYEFNFDGIALDTSKGKCSYIQANLVCSDTTELQGL